MIYLDHNATTPIASEVAEAMVPFLNEEFGNPSSAHRIGKKAREALEKARSQVARFIGCKPSEVLFTSGGSEANNMVLKGVAYSHKRRGDHIITTQIEHPAIINPCLFLMNQGYDVTFVPVDRDGMIDPDDVVRAIRNSTVLISVMHANNETGTIQPVKEIGRIARERGIFFHTDAAQSLGKIMVQAYGLNADFLTLAGHKLYAPKGIGALFIKEGILIEPLIHGAGQEGGRRAGTENVFLAVGLGAACELAAKRMKEDSHRIMSLRDRLQAKIQEQLDGVILNGHNDRRLPNTLNLSFSGIKGGNLLERLPDICASTGAACHDRSVKLSHVLEAMKVPLEVGIGAVRLSLGRGNSQEEIDQASDLIIECVKEMRGF